MPRRHFSQTDCGGIEDNPEKDLEVEAQPVCTTQRQTHSFYLFPWATCGSIVKE